MRLSLNALPAFRAVAELQNLRAAAERLHLTHSAVSQQIRGLEEQLGFDLFERSGRGIVLNPAGAALLCSVQEALALLDDGMRTAAAAAAGSSLQLRVSVLPSFAQRWMLPRMARWRARHPELTLEMETSQQVVDLLRDGFHAALRFGRGPWAGSNPNRYSMCRCRSSRWHPRNGARPAGPHARDARRTAPAGRARCLATLVQLGRAAHSGEPRRDLQ